MGFIIANPKITGISDTALAKDSAGNVVGLAGPIGTLFPNGASFPTRSKAAGFELSAFYSRPATDYQVVGAGSSIAVDATITRSGAQTLKVTVNRGSATNTDINPLHSWTNFVCFSGRVGFWVYVPDYTLLTSIIPKISHNDAAFTNGAFQSYVFSDGDKKYNGWHFIGFDKAEWTGSFGTQDWTAVIGTVRLTINQNSATPTAIYIDNCVAGWRSKGKLLITADDGNASWFNYGVPVLDSLGIKHTHGVIASLVDSSAAWVTSAQLASAYANGHDLAVHGTTAMNDASFTSDALRTVDINLNKNFLVNRGYTRASNFYIWPNGVYQLAGAPDQLITLIKSLGFAAGRETSSPRHFKHGAGTSAGSSDLKYHTPILAFSGVLTVAALKVLIDDVVTYGDTGVLMYHEIKTSAASGATERNLSDFIQDMEYAALKRDAGLIDIVTVSQWLSGLT